MSIYSIFLYCVASFAAGLLLSYLYASSKNRREVSRVAAGSPLSPSASLPTSNLARVGVLRQEELDLTERLAELQRKIDLEIDALQIFEIAPLPDRDDELPLGIAQDRLAAINTKQKEFIRAGKAVVTNRRWAINGSENQGAALQKDLAKLGLRAYASESQTLLTSLTWANRQATREKLSKLQLQLDSILGAMHLSIDPFFARLKGEQIDLYAEIRERKRSIEQKRREEARQQREEQRDLEKLTAEKQAEEIELYAADKDLAAAEERYFSAHSDEEKERLRAQVAFLKEQITKHHEKLNRLTAAQQGRSGWVYIISNEGSFGAGVYKIGMTRRSDPQERVDELGDASVPFDFDHHAYIRTDDAPELEKKLHRALATHRLNRVNNRREFFKLVPGLIEKALLENGIDATFRRHVEAEEWRQSQTSASPLSESTTLVNSLARGGTNDSKMNAQLR